MRSPAEDADVFRAIRDLLVRQGPDLDWAAVVAASGVSEKELLARHGSLEALLIAALEPDVSREPPASPPAGGPTEQGAPVRRLPQLAGIFRRLGPPGTNTPEPASEIKRLDSPPPPDAAAR